MVQIKAWIFYLDIYAENSYKWDRRINMYGAIASSSSMKDSAFWYKHVIETKGVEL